MGYATVDTVVQNVIIQEAQDTIVEIVENKTHIQPSVTDVNHIEVINTNTVLAINVDNSITSLVISKELVSVIEVGIQGPTGATGPSGGEDEIPYSTQVDFVGDTLIYKGQADPGTATSGALWRIQKIEFVGVDEDVVITWADGDALFNNVWDNRLSLTYV